MMKMIDDWEKWYGLPVLHWQMPWQRPSFFGGLGALVRCQVMVRNIPKACSREAIVELLSPCGLANRFELRLKTGDFHIPPRPYSLQNGESMIYVYILYIYISNKQGDTFIMWIKPLCIFRFPCFAVDFQIGQKILSCERKFAAVRNYPSYNLGVENDPVWKTIVLEAFPWWFDEFDKHQTHLIEIPEIFPSMRELGQVHLLLHALWQAP